MDEMKFAQCSECGCVMEIVDDRAIPLDARQVAGRDEAANEAQTALTNLQQRLNTVEAELQALRQVTRT